jgi:hypothetical protein
MKKRKLIADIGKRECVLSNLSSNVVAALQAFVKCIVKFFKKINKHLQNLNAVLKNVQMYYKYFDSGLVLLLMME